MGLETLIDATQQTLPEAVRGAFAAAQKVSAEAKVKRSRLVAAGAAALAATAGAVPVPFSDALALVPIQVTMLAGISATFGLPASRQFLGTLVSSTIGSTTATAGSRMLAGRHLKFMPGAGSIIGGQIPGAWQVF